MADERRQRRLVVLGLIALELMLLSGPFLLSWAWLGWHDWRGLPRPQRVPFVAPMLLTGVLLAVAWVGYDVVRFLRRRRRR